MVSPSGKIMLKRKGWIIRIFSIVTLISLILIYTYFGIISPEEKPIMIYTSFMISLSIIVFVFGWIFFRNPSSLNKNSDNEAMSKEKDLFSIIIPVFNQKEIIETVIDSVYASTYKNIEV